VDLEFFACCGCWFLVLVLVRLFWIIWGFGLGFILECGWIGESTFFADCLG
jgi:hypothetical protein